MADLEVGGEVLASLPLTQFLLQSNSGKELEQEGAETSG